MGGITKETCSHHVLLHVCIGFNVLILPFSLIMYRFLLFLFYSSRSAGLSDYILVIREVYISFSTHL